MARRAVPPDDIPAGDFFLSWVPARVAGDPDRQARLGETRATVEFALDGEGGGHFTVRIEAGQVHGQAGPAAEPDLRVALDVATWRELNAGTLTAPEAFLRRRVQLEGSLALAVKLHVILG